MADLLIGLGSNVGDRESYLSLAVSNLAESIDIKVVSSLYWTEPVGYRDQDWFFNAALVGRSSKPPAEILGVCAKIEAACGRRREIPNGPRTLDIDLLLFGDLVSNENGLIVPHPRMHQRRFVLAPAAEIAPDWPHPVIGKTLAELLQGLPQGEVVEKVKRPDWPPKLEL